MSGDKDIVIKLCQRKKRGAINQEFICIEEIKQWGSTTPQSGIHPESEHLFSKLNLGGRYMSSVVPLLSFFHCNHLHGAWRYQHQHLGLAGAADLRCSYLCFQVAKTLVFLCWED